MIRHENRIRTWMRGNRVSMGIQYRHFGVYGRVGERYIEGRGDKVCEYKQYYPSVGQQQQTPWDVCWFISLYALGFLSLPKLFTWTKADTGSDSEWPDARDSQKIGRERSHEIGGSMETTDQNEMCWTDVLRPLGTRGDRGKIGIWK